MRITILTIGCRSDIEPYVPLAVGLVAAGHTVTLATHAEFQSLLTDGRVTFSALTANVKSLLAGEGGEELLDAGRNPIKVFKSLAKLGTPIVIEVFRDALRACQEAELIICSTAMYFAGEALAEKLSCRLVYGSLQPMAPTHYERSVMSPPLPSGITYFGRFGYNWVSQLMTLQMLCVLMRDKINLARAQVLNLPPRPKWFSTGVFADGPLFIYGYSPRIIAQPPDWSDRQHVTGYWLTTDTVQTESTNSLTSFLDAGTPPLLMHLDGISEKHEQRVLNLAIEALPRDGLRAVIVTGLKGLARPASETLFFTDTVPPAALLSCMAAIVHHGGAGMTGLGLKAGLPAVVIPFMADQLFWGHRLRELGVAAASIPQTQVTVDRLGTALTTVASNASMSARATALSDAIRREDGVTRAVELVSREGRNKH